MSGIGEGLVLAAIKGSETERICVVSSLKDCGGVVESAPRTDVGVAGEELNGDVARSWHACGAVL